MKIVNKKSKIALCLVLTLFVSCKDLTELNINPNGVDPNTANPNLVMPHVVTETSRKLLQLGYGNVGGIMQHTQLDGWFGDHNSYYFGRQDWNDYYLLLTNNKLVYDRSVELGYEFQQGEALVMKSMLFGLITDIWGDAPYTSALQGELQGEHIQPAFDSQETIYMGIITDLQTANTILSKDKTEYEGIVEDADVLYAGDLLKWRKLANSLLLRYYMRISSKKPDVSKAGIEKIMSDPDQYPIITSPSDDAAIGFPGTSVNTSWPGAIAFDISESNYSRMKMDSLFVGRLLDLDDPRIGVYAEKVEIPLLVDELAPEKTDEIVTIGGKEYRRLSTDMVENIRYNTNSDYVGLPTQLVAPGSYNLNPNAETQGAYNPHVSQLNKMYKEKSGPLLKARMLSAAEVHFILAEAALKGWNVGGGPTAAQTHYEAGIKASFETWGIAGESAGYIAGEAAFDGTLEQLIEQKWIASWTAATEAWFDYRRTGYPDLKTGQYAFRKVLPVRFPYGDAEVGQNQAKVNEALDRLEQTNFVQSDGANSAWAKPWVLQGTGKPW